MKTLFELEQEDATGFRNPTVTDAEFDRIRQVSNAKRALESLNKKDDDLGDDDDSE